MAAHTVAEQLGLELARKLRAVEKVAETKFDFENHSRTLLLSARLRRCGRAFDMPDLEEMDGHLVALATKNLVRHQIRFQTCVRSMRFGRAVVPFSDFPTHPSPPHLDHVQPRTWVETFRASEDWDLLAIVGYKGLTVDLASLLDITSTLAANGGLVAVLHGPDKTSFYSAEETAIALDIITTFLRDQAPPGNIAGEEDTIRLQLVQVAFSTALTDLVSNTAPARGTDLAINWVYANVLHSLSTSFAAQTQLIETPDGPDDDFWPPAFTTGHGNRDDHTERKSDNSEDDKTEEPSNDEDHQ